MKRTFLDKLTLGYRFDRDREVISLLYICYFIIVLFAFVLVLLHTSDEELVLVSYRYHSIVMLCLFLVWLIRIRLFTLARVLMLTLIPFLLIILPPLAGLTSDEFYFWFPYVPIALSLIPHFILHTSRHRKALIICLVVYFLMALLSDNYLILMGEGSEKIIPFILENRFYYNLIPLIIYLFVNLALGLVFAKNYSYQQIMLRQQNELIQAEKMASLGILTTGIAHEINNPLNFISGGLHALNTLKTEYQKLEGPLSPEKKKLRKQMDKIMENSMEGVLRASDIISSLKFFANPGKAVKKDHDLEKVLYSVMLSVEKKLPYHISLSKDIPPGFIIHCYEEQLQQVFINILINAIEAIEQAEEKKQRKIHITAYETIRGKTEVSCISIRNNGPAIPEDEIGKIFDPFYTLKGDGKGKGLGMAISYMIVSEHQGWIEARNEGDNVVFDVILPKS
ncbi:MAG: GHKL domain-containing protein [Bacteroidia bacterium]|nr:MAG: GHKL domain-containing protein [Bacteroidia bacterium]